MTTLSFFEWQLNSVGKINWIHFRFSFFVFVKSKMKNENTFIFRFQFLRIKNEKRKYFCFSFYVLWNQKWKTKTLLFLILVFKKSKTKNENTFVFCFLFMIFQNEKRMDADIHGPLTVYKSSSCSVIMWCKIDPSMFFFFYIFCVAVHINYFSRWLIVIKQKST